MGRELIDGKLSILEEIARRRAGRVWRGVEVLEATEEDLAGVLAVEGLSVDEGAERDGVKLRHVARYLPHPVYPDQRVKLDGGALLSFGGRVHLRGDTQALAALIKAFVAAP